MSFYAYTDKALKYLRRFYIREFNNAKMQIRADSLNVINVSHRLYDAIAKETERVFRLIAKEKYKEISGKDFLVSMWLSGILDESNELTGYIWRNDIDRKRAYFAESVLSGEQLDKAVKKALKYWYNQQKQYADIVTDAAALKAYTDTNTQFVRWITQDDEKVCAVCNSRDGKIYPIKYAPRKPHYNCRCYLVRA